MEPFQIQIAGITFLVHPMYETTRVYCQKYLSDYSAKYEIFVTVDDLAREQELAEIEAVEEGLKIRKFTDPFLERAVIQRKIANILLEHDTLLLHGSTVGVDGAAYLFTAACGTGKSTHTRLWREVFGDRAVMINDDKPFLQILADGVIAHGSPWSGKHGLDTNISVPLKGICVLHRGLENRIFPASSDALRKMLRHQCLIPDDPALAARTATLVEKLMDCVPLWEMDCNKSPDAARISYGVMSGTVL